MRSGPRIALAWVLASCAGGASRDGAHATDRPSGDAQAGDARSSDAPLAADAPGGAPELGAREDAGVREFALPPSDAPFDYQLGGAYPPPAGVRVVARDRTASPAAGLYNICYVNGFQAQPGEADWWLREHPDLLLRDASNRPVFDPDWNEMLLDPSTADKRARLAAIVGAWIDGCARDGFDAVEIDNLDTYARSGARISQDHAVAFMRQLSERAHAAGIAIAQKNAAEILPRAGEMGTDFAVSEECNRYRECGDYTAVYGNLVLVIEYRRADFEVGCRDFPRLSIVLRDLDLGTPDGAGYVFDGC